MTSVPDRPATAIRAVCLDWGGTLMSENGPPDRPMGLWPTLEVLPGARECLTRLHGVVPLAIATNATVSRRPQIEQALERVGLLQFFDDIFCFTEIGHRKSEPGFWAVVEDRLGVPRTAIAMVGDSKEQDALAPRQFGLQAYWLNPAGATEAHPTDVADTAGDGVPEVRDLEQFARIVSASVVADGPGRIG